MTDAFELRPDKIAFLRYRLIVTGLFLLSLSFILIWLFPSIRGEVVPIAILLVFIKGMYLHVTYKKTSYQFKSNKMVVLSGGLFSNTETELLFKNVTHVRLVKPFFLYQFTGAAHLLIESAGSSSVEAGLRYIKMGDKYFGYIEKLLAYNNVNVSRDTLLYEESPHSLGVLITIIKGFFAVFFVTLFSLALFLGKFIFENQEMVLRFLTRHRIPLILVFSLFVIVLLVRMWVRYYDVKRRTYYIYNNLIYYDEGFLNKVKAIIPSQNLSDTYLNQGLLDKILGLYEIRISCQGGGSEIQFANIVNAKKMQQKLSQLTDNSSDEAISFSMDSKRSFFFAWFSIIFLGLGLLGFSFKGEIKWLFVVISGFIFFLFILGIIVTLVKIKNTAYYVKKKSFERIYSFLSNKVTSFTNSKIVSLVVKQSFVDKLYNTFTLELFSIGSFQTLLFKHIKTAKDLAGRIFPKENQTFSLKSAFTIRRFFFANIYLTIILLIAVIPFFMGNIILKIISLVVFFITLVSIFISYKRHQHSEIRFYSSYMVFTVGWLYKRTHYVPFEEVKGITITRYPFTNTSGLRINVAGMTRQKRGKETVEISNGFTLDYVKDINGREIDYYIYKQQMPSQENVLLKRSPDIGNMVTKTVIVSIVIFPLIVLLPVSIPLVIWYMRLRRYILEDYRIVFVSGLLYRKSQSIVKNKIDHIKKREGFLNKIFKNGEITINTTGSFQPEMVIKDISGYSELYEYIQKEYL